MFVQKERNLRIEKKKIEQDVAISMLSLISTRSWYLAYCPQRTYTKIAKESGAKIDYWPIWPVPNIQAYYALVPNQDLKIAVSGSSSFRSEKWPWELIKHKNRLLAAQAWAVLPHRDSLESVQTFASLASGGKMPVVIYPETLEKLKKRPRINPRSNLTIQPTPELFKSENIKTPAQANHYLEKTKVNGWTYDTLHSRFLLEDPKLLGAVLRRTILVHLSVFRNDNSRPGYSSINTTTEGLDILNGTRKTEILSHLELVLKNLPKNLNVPIVLEFSIGNYNQHVSTSKNHTLMSPKDLSIILKPLVEGTKSVIKSSAQT